jgi:hypothetical protein
MKKLLFSFVVTFFITTCFAQQAATNGIKKNVTDSSKKIFEAEASCGSCKLNMKGKGCFLAIRFNGNNYYAQGAGIDDYGDAHHQEGFCNAIRKVFVSGNIKGDSININYLKVQ